MSRQSAPTIHLSYHDGEHYNSVRMASDTGSGPPKPIAVQERAALAKDWSSFGPAQVELVICPSYHSALVHCTPRYTGRPSSRQLAEHVRVHIQVEQVMQGTGCYDDKEAVQRALQDAKGNPDEVRRYPAKNA